jgi:hypothetical protein
VTLFNGVIAAEFSLTTRELNSLKIMADKLLDGITTLATDIKRVKEGLLSAAFVSYCYCSSECAFGSYIRT